MNTYPTLPTLFDPRDEEIRCPMDVREATNGTVYTRLLGTVDNRRIEVTHPRLTSVQWSTFTAFRTANKGIKFTYNRTRAGNAESWTARFDGRLRIRYEKPGVITVTVGMIIE